MADEIFARTSRCTMKPTYSITINLNFCQLYIPNFLKVVTGVCCFMFITKERLKLLVLKERLNKVYINN